MKTRQGVIERYTRYINALASKYPNGVKEPDAKEMSRLIGVSNSIPTFAVKCGLAARSNNGYVFMPNPSKNDINKLRRCISEYNTLNNKKREKRKSVKEGKMLAPKNKGLKLNLFWGLIKIG